LSVGTVRNLVEEPYYGRLAMAPSGDILVSTKAGLELLSTDGRRRTVAARKTDDPSDYLPLLLPDSDRFLFLRRVHIPFDIWQGNLNSAEPVRLFSADSQVEYADSGHLLFVKGNTLFAQSFDTRKAMPVGAAQPLVNGVARLVPSWLAGFSVSRNGVLTFRPGTASTTVRLTWRDRVGKELGTIGEVADYTSPQLSPDDKRLAVSVRDLYTGQRDIWIFDLVRGGSSRLTSDPSDDLNPTWSPDGARIAFTSNRRGMRDLYITSA